MFFVDSNSFLRQPLHLVPLRFDKSREWRNEFFKEMKAGFLRVSSFAVWFDGSAGGIKFRGPIKGLFPGGKGRRERRPSPSPWPVIDVFFFSSCGRFLFPTTPRLFAHINILRGPGKNYFRAGENPIVHKERFTRNGRRLLSSSSPPIDNENGELIIFLSSRTRSTLEKYSKKKLLEFQIWRT